MNRFGPILILILSLAGALSAYADDEADDSSALPTPVEEQDHKKPSYLKDDLQFTVNAGVGVNSYQWIFTGGLQLDFNANPVLGIGFRSTFDYGLAYDNLNINAYVLFKFWWFYFGPGVSFLVQDMTIPADDPDYVAAFDYDAVASMAFTVGARIPLVRIGPGFMTVDFSIDWYQTDIPLTIPDSPMSLAMIDELLNGTVYAFTIGARLGYTF